ncbi:hypothetical protein [Streptomyces sp. NPDC058739]|uniref:hypothetical protein n=1 Tax=Streptomyces sp. NPDC058739 TaxID=3346618 RepID=UPI0036BF2DA0
MTWSWKYIPDEETVAAGAPPGFLAEVEKKAADELVRAAAALYLHGPAYQEADETKARSTPLSRPTPSCDRVSA